jgi:hypothetical protein
VTAVVAGARVNRPARRAPWLLLAGALSCFAAGQVSFRAAARLSVALPFPSFADVFYLSYYPQVAAGLPVFIRCRTPNGDRRSLLDALTITSGAALLSWTFLIRPYVSSPLNGLEKSATPPGGAAAPQPDMAAVTEPAPRQQVTVSPARLALLMLASLIAPIVLLTTMPERPGPGVSVIAVFFAVLYLLYSADCGTRPCPTVARWTGSGSCGKPACPW